MRNQKTQTNVFTESDHTSITILTAALNSTRSKKIAGLRKEISLSLPLSPSYPPPRHASQTNSYRQALEPKVIIWGKYVMYGELLSPIHIMCYTFQTYNVLYFTYNNPPYAISHAWPTQVIWRPYSWEGAQMTLRKIFSTPVPDAFSLGMQQKNENRKLCPKGREPKSHFFNERGDLTKQIFCRRWNRLMWISW